jgi:sporulation protein YlmC with PRC-barrel domain
MDASGVVRADRIEASQLKGSRVYGLEGALIGTVQDIVLSVADGRVVEVIVWFGKDDENEASYYSVPWSALVPSDERGYVVDRGAAVRVELPGDSSRLTPGAIPRDGTAERE